MRRDGRSTKSKMAGLLLLLCAGVVAAQQTPATLRAEIEALKPPIFAWREIQWKSCLLEALAEARAKNKPVLLWLVGPGEGLDGRC